MIDRHRGTLVAEGMTLRIRDPEGGVAPLGAVEQVVIIGAVDFNANVIHRCHEKEIDLIFLTGRRLKFAGRICGRLHKNATLRLQQFRAQTPSFRQAFSQNLVLMKITKERETVSEWNTPAARRARETLDYCIRKVQEETLEEESLRGVEGSAHAAYFSALTAQFGESWGFHKRTRRPPRDPINALLSLTYTMVHYETVRELEISGFDPFLGFYHDLHPGRESLACDIVELFRTDVDLWILERIRAREFRPRDFAGDSETGYYLKKNARGRYWGAYREWIVGKRPAIKREIAALKKLIGHEEGSILERI